MGAPSPRSLATADAVGWATRELKQIYEA